MAGCYIGGCDMFIGRKKELAVLEKTYSKPGFQMTVIYGRRRIGKSTLITEFMRNKKGSYFIAVQSSLEENVRKWSEQYISDIVPGMSGAEFSDIDAFFKFVVNNSGDEKIVIALDEIPYIAEADASFLSRFQAAIDGNWSKKNIYLIICGSAISFMEKEILSEKSPLFGRRTNQIFLKPFDYVDSAQFVPSYNFEEKAIVYGVTGGVAKYLSLFDDRLTLDENIINNYFDPYGFLFEEPQNLLMQEFRTVRTYNSVIGVCASGANKMNEIADKAHISTATLTYVLNSLMTVGIIGKISSMTEANNRKKTSYEIIDGLYRFWYGFVQRAGAAIATNRGDVFYYSNVKDKLHGFMGPVFESMCRDYVLKQGLAGNLSCTVTNVGRWWGAGHDRIPTDIDVVGIDESTKKAVIGECKFKNEVMDKDVYESLMSRRGLIAHEYTETEYLLFSLSGFSKWVTDAARREGNVRLIRLEDLYETP